MSRHGMSRTSLFTQPSTAKTSNLAPKVNLRRGPESSPHAQNLMYILLGSMFWVASIMALIRTRSCWYFKTLYSQLPGCIPSPRSSGERLQKCAMSLKGSVSYGEDAIEAILDVNYLSCCHSSIFFWFFRSYNDCCSRSPTFKIVEGRIVAEKTDVYCLF